MQSKRITECVSLALLDDLNKRPIFLVGPPTVENKDKTKIYFATTSATGGNKELLKALAEGDEPRCSTYIEPVGSRLFICDIKRNNVYYPVSKDAVTAAAKALYELVYPENEWHKCGGGLFARHCPGTVFVELSGTDYVDTFNVYGLLVTTSEINSLAAFAAK